MSVDRLNVRITRNGKDGWLKSFPSRGIWSISAMPRYFSEAEDSSQKETSLNLLGNTPDNANPSKSNGNGNCANKNGNGNGHHGKNNENYTEVQIPQTPQTFAKQEAKQKPLPLDFRVTLANMFQAVWRDVEMSSEEKDRELEKIIKKCDIPDENFAHAFILFRNVLLDEAKSTIVREGDPSVIYGCANYISHIAEKNKFYPEALSLQKLGAGSLSEGERLFIFSDNQPFEICFRHMRLLLLCNNLDPVLINQLLSAFELSHELLTTLPAPMTNHFSLLNYQYYAHVISILNNETSNRKMKRNLKAKVNEMIEFKLNACEFFALQEPTCLVNILPVAVGILRNKLQLADDHDEPTPLSSAKSIKTISSTLDLTLITNGCLSELVTKKIEGNLHYKLTSIEDVRRVVWDFVPNLRDLIDELASSSLTTREFISKLDDLARTHVSSLLGSLESIGEFELKNTICHFHDVTNGGITPETPVLPSEPIIEKGRVSSPETELLSACTVLSKMSSGEPAEQVLRACNRVVSFFIDPHETTERRLIVNLRSIRGIAFTLENLARIIDIKRQLDSKLSSTYSPNGNGKSNGKGKQPLRKIKDIYHSIERTLRPDIEQKQIIEARAAKARKVELEELHEALFAFSKVLGTHIEIYRSANPRTKNKQEEEVFSYYKKLLNFSLNSCLNFFYLEGSESLVNETIDLMIKNDPLSFDQVVAKGYVNLENGIKGFVFQEKIRHISIELQNMEDDPDLPRVRELGDLLISLHPNVVNITQESAWQYAKTLIDEAMYRARQIASQINRGSLIGVHYQEAVNDALPMAA